MAALRYTDGAANITIYQAKTSAGQPPWRSNAGMESAKVDDVWLTVDGDIPKVGKQAILGALKKSGATKSAQLQTRAARMFSGTEDTIEMLRAMGLDFEDVVACLIAGNGSAAKTTKAGRSLLDGHSLAQIARDAKIDSKRIREGLERFWNMREE